MKKYYKESRTDIAYKQLKSRITNWIVHILRRNFFVHHVIKGED